MQAPNYWSKLLCLVQLRVGFCSSCKFSYDYYLSQDTVDSQLSDSGCSNSAHGSWTAKRLEPSALYLTRLVNSFQTYDKYVSKYSNR